MVASRPESRIQDILCSRRQDLAQRALRYRSEPGEWFHRIPSGACQHDFCSKACSSEALAFQNAVFWRLDGIPHPGVLISLGLAKSLVLIQGIFGWVLPQAS